MCSIIVSCTLIFSIIEAIRTKRLPTYFEFIALFLGLLGALEMVIPEFFERIFCCKNKKNPPSTQQDDALTGTMLVDDKTKQPGSFAGEGKGSMHAARPTQIQ